MKWIQFSKEFKLRWTVKNKAGQNSKFMLPTQTVKQENIPLL